MNGTTSRENLYLHKYYGVRVPSAEAEPAPKSTLSREKPQKMPWRYSVLTGSMAIETMLYLFVEQWIYDGRLPAMIYVVDLFAMYVGPLLILSCMVWFVTRRRYPYNVMHIFGVLVMYVTAILLTALSF